MALKEEELLSTIVTQMAHEFYCISDKLLLLAWWLLKKNSIVVLKLLEFKRWISDNERKTSARLIYCRNTDCSEGKCAAKHT